MSNIFVTPNMNLPSPIPGSEAGPQWATDNFNCLSILDAHNHASGSGVQINPSGININADLTWNQTNNAIDLRSVRFKAQSAALALASDLGCLYVAGADLYFNDEAGNQIRITSGGSVAGSSGTITGLPSGTASAAYASGSGSFVFQQATSTGANLDVASIAIRYPGSYPTPSGNYIQLQAPTSLASAYSLTLPALPAANNTFLTVSTAGIIGSSITVDNSTLAISGSNVIVKSSGITNTQIAANSLTSLAKNATSLSQNLVVSNTNATNSLAIIRGIVDSSRSSAGGEGFSVATGATGFSTITFTTAFSDTPVVTVSPVSNSDRAAEVVSVSSSAVTILTFATTTGVASNVGYHFIAIGQRA